MAKSVAAKSVAAKSRFLLAALMSLLLVPSGWAQSAYPNKPVRFIVGFTAGSATDVTARLFAAKFAELWGVPVTVENVPGAGGSVGGDRVAKSAPDGTTFYWGANGALTINPTLLAASQTYDVQRDLAPVARLLTMASIVAVNNDVPVKTFAELVALAKKEPGKLSYASPGVGTPQHIAGELLKAQAGINVTHVPYRGAVVTDVIGGRITMTLQNMGVLLPHVREGRLRGIAVTSLKRSAVIDLPTVAESGLPGFEATSWFGLMAPAGTPRAVVAKVHQDALKVAAMPDVRDKLTALGLDTASDGPEALAAIIKADIGKWAKVIKDANIKVGN